jgi:GNAT superfamily N-acetyltransferase
VLRATVSTGILAWSYMTAGSTDSHIVVKPFAWHDWLALWAVRLAQLAEHGILLDPAAIAKSPQPGVDDEHEWDFHHIDQVYLRGAGNFWLAWYADCPVGYVGGQDVGGAIELRRMYVKASYRRLGVGTALVEALIAHSHTQGIRAIELWTAVNGPGRRLYRALGFRETEGPGIEFQDVTARTGYTPGADEIRMRYRMTTSPPARDIIHAIIQWATAI